ncbi:MAG: LysR family transcriptional regulator [Treponema sp.]|jgi:DNA-binding transcriptional LysR family regulator|nr:LysR family transcriptional regulator [Treponema sp.]
MTDLEIRYFLEIVSQGLSFTKAAQALHVSQPALTHHIKSLGKELEVQLLDTTKRNAVCLTPAGKLYFDFFSECREKFSKVRNEAKVLVDQESGNLRVAYMSGWDLTDLLNSKEVFCKTFPHIDFSITVRGIRALKTGLLRDQYDLLVAMSDQFKGESNVCTREYLRVPYIVLFSSKHPLAQKENLNIMDFKNDIFFCTNEEDCPFLKRAHETYCKSKGFIPRYQFLPNMESIVLALQNGNGYTIFDDLVRIKNDPTFKYLRLDNYLILHYVWKADNNNKALRLFLESCVFNKSPSSGISV